MNKKEKELDKRNRLMAATEEVFSRRGYAQATVDEIISLADTGKGTLYKYFGNKDDLFYTLVSQKHSFLMKQLWPVANAADKGIEEKLTGILTLWIDFLRKNTVLWQVLCFEMTGSTSGYVSVLDKDETLEGMRLTAKWGELPPVEEQEKTLRYHRLIFEELQPVLQVYREGIRQNFFNKVASHDDIAIAIFLSVAMLVFFHTANNLENVPAEELAANIVKTRLYGLAAVSRETGR